MGSAPAATSTKSTQTDGKYHVSPNLNLAYTTIIAAMDSPQAKPAKKKKNSDLMFMLDDIEVKNPEQSQSTISGGVVNNKKSVIKPELK